MSLIRKLVVVAGVMLLACQLLAAQSFYGRWSHDTVNCAEDGPAPPLAVTPLALQWPDTACAIRTSYRVGDSWHIRARCPDAASDMAAALHLRGDRLTVDWGGATLALRRCP